MINVIDETFSIKSDKYNWILIEKNIGKKVKHHFFSNIKQLSNFLGEYKLREFLVKVYVDLVEKSTGTPSYSSVMEDATSKLERYIEECINGKK